MNQPEEREPQVVVVRCQHDADDYTVTLSRPDGSEIRVLIPHEKGTGFPSKCVERSRGPFGLNLVTDGHYS